MCRLLLFLCFIILPTFLPLRSFAQSDSTSTTQTEPSTEPVEIIYSAESITYDTQDSTLILVGQAEVIYGEITLRAGQIRFNTQTEILFAESIQDSTNQEGDVQLPTLVDPQGTLVGERMQYDIKTRRGRILGGKTKYEQGFFEGTRIRVDGENTLRIDDGSYSTCDIPGHKHYSLRSRKTKVLPNDKALVKDVVAYVYGVPVFYFPFYVLPLKRGRHSGFTVPNYGTSATDGTYLRNIGYYWAASEYWDLKMTGDFQSARGFLLRPQLRYAKSRRVNGNIRGTYQSDFNLNTTGWDLEGSHWQELRPDLRINGRAQFANNLQFVQSTTRGSDPGRLQSSLTSSMGVDKFWGQKSLNLSVQRSDREISSSQTTALNFRLPTRPILRPRQRRQTIGGMPDMNPPPVNDSPSLLQSILFSYNGRLQDQRSDRTSAFTTDASLTEPDSTINTQNNQQNLVHQFSFSSQQTNLGWLKLQPQASYTETWMRTSEDVRTTVREDSVITMGEDDISRQNMYSAGLRANTTLYGLFQPNLGRLESIRHVMTPSVTFSQTGPRNVSRTVNFDLRNILQAKTVHNENERKFDVLLANFSTGYNFNATTRRLADLSTSLRAPSPVVNFDAQFSHRFYETATDAFRFPWLTRGSLNTTINLRGRTTSARAPGNTNDPTLSSLSGIPDSGTLNRDNAPGRSLSSFGDDRFDEDFDRAKGPWAVTLTHRYAFSRSDPTDSFLTSSHILRMSNRFNLDRITSFMRVSNRLTRKWRVEHSINYDIRNRRIDSQTFNFNRDLHCWEFSVRYTPNGFNKGVFFRLNIIAHPEIKLEQQRLLQ